MMMMMIFVVVMGKAEGSAENWHGHVTALTVAPEYRRLGLAAKLMHSLEDISEKYDTNWIALLNVTLKYIVVSGSK